MTVYEIIGIIGIVIISLSIIGVAYYSVHPPKSRKIQ